ncbi:uncharacterized protein LOC142502044 isoform X2 [Ascaphus truei]|uniref:uncharacterized protein LOC142502044 isoform X2 n=1 Tax=Ascaphus truei TaxID=8439 RepID=UPI003F5967A3
MAEWHHGNLTPRDDVAQRPVMLTLLARFHLRVHSVLSESATRLCRRMPGAAVPPRLRHRRDVTHPMLQCFALYAAEELHEHIILLV